MPSPFTSVAVFLMDLKLVRGFFSGEHCMSLRSDFGGRLHSPPLKAVIERVLT